MKLNDKRYQWLYDKCNDMKRLIVTLDYLKERHIGYSDETFRKVSDTSHHLGDTDEQTSS